MKKVLIAFILGGIIFGSIGIYAANYLASDISYTLKDGTKTSVDEALDILYDEITDEIEFKTVTKSYSGRYNSYANLTYTFTEEEFPNKVLGVIGVTCTTAAPYGRITSMNISDRTANIQLWGSSTGINLTGTITFIGY